MKKLLFELSPDGILVPTAKEHSMGFVDLNMLLLGDAGRSLIVYIQCHDYAKWGLSYGDLAILHLDVSPRIGDLMLRQSGDEFVLEFCQMHDQSMPHCGVFTSVIKFLKPVLSEENLRLLALQNLEAMTTPDAYLRHSCDLNFLLLMPDEDYLLIEMKDDAMTDDRIFNGDLVVVNQDTEIATMAIQRLRDLEG